MKKATFIFVAIVLVLGAWWALASVHLAPSLRCGWAKGSGAAIDVCYWDTQERVF
jgi:hypothetical protein